MVHIKSTSFSTSQMPDTAVIGTYANFLKCGTSIWIQARCGLTSLVQKTIIIKFWQANHAADSY